MRSHLTISASLVAALFVTSGSVLAQTGEFAATIPGSVVHAGYGLQDWLQDLRNGVREPPPLQNVQDPVIILPPPPPPPVKPKKTAKKVTTTSQVQTKPSQ
jgi:hypothetical protein